MLRINIYLMWKHNVYVKDMSNKGLQKIIVHEDTQ